MNKRQSQQRDREPGFGNAEPIEVEVEPAAFEAASDLGQADADAEAKANLAAETLDDDADALDLASEAVENARDKETLDALDAAERRIEAEGVDLENFISSRTFATQEELMMRVGSQPKGTIVALGLIVGVCSSVERSAPKDVETLARMRAMRPGETMPESIKLKGDFQATVFETGEIVTATALYLPSVMAEAIEREIIDGALNVQLNMELSCIATGRMIPYRFKVRSFIATPRQRAMTALQIAAVNRLKAQGRDSLVRKLTHNA